MEGYEDESKAKTGIVECVLCSTSCPKSGLFEAASPPGVRGLRTDYTASQIYSLVGMGVVVGTVHLYFGSGFLGSRVDSLIYCFADPILGTAGDNRERESAVISDGGIGAGLPDFPAERHTG